MHHQPTTLTCDAGKPTSLFMVRAGDLRQRIDSALLAYTELEGGCPTCLKEAMQYALLAPGKRLRPILVMLAAEACGATAERRPSRSLRGRDGPCLLTGPR